MVKISINIPEETLAKLDEYAKNEYLGNRTIALTKLLETIFLSEHSKFVILSIDDEDEKNLNKIMKYYNLKDFKSAMYFTINELNNRIRNENIMTLNDGTRLQIQDNENMSEEDIEKLKKAIEDANK